MFTFSDYKTESCLEVILCTPTLITEIEVWAPNKLDFELTTIEADFLISWFPDSM